MKPSRNVLDNSMKLKKEYKMKAIKKNLKQQVGIGCTDKKILYCPECSSEFSGNAGDYFMLPEDHVFTCEDCNCELELVTKHISITYS